VGTRSATASCWPTQNRSATPDRRQPHQTHPAQRFTAIAPRTLGPQAPRSGQLAAGYDADVITLSADPLADIAVLADPANVIGVWTGGRQVKRPQAA
jgi:cytosine/adenosine deaminase-related metal-dependent hydrolase